MCLFPQIKKIMKILSWCVPCNHFIRRDMSKYEAVYFVGIFGLTCSPNFIDVLFCFTVISHVWMTTFLTTENNKTNKVYLILFYLHDPETGFCVPVCKLQMIASLK